MNRINAFELLCYAITLLYRGFGSPGHSSRKTGLLYGRNLIRTWNTDIGNNEDLDLKPRACQMILMEKEL